MALRGDGVLDCSDPLPGPSSDAVAVVVGRVSSGTRVVVSVMLVPLPKVGVGVTVGSVASGVAACGSGGRSTGTSALFPEAGTLSRVAASRAASVITSGLSGRWRSVVSGQGA